MFNTVDYKKMKKSRVRNEIFSMDRILFNLEKDVEDQEILFKAQAKPKPKPQKKVEEKQDVSGSQPAKVKESTEVPENPKRKSVEDLFNGKSIQGINTKELEFILDRLDTMSKTNRYAVVALDRVYAEYLTRITSGKAGAPAQSSAPKQGSNNKPVKQDPKVRLQELTAKINGATKAMNSTKDVKKKNKLKTKINVYKQERDKLNKQISGGGA